MLDRVRQAGRVSWATVGIALFVGIIGLIVWYFRVVLPPLLLAGAIVFILNPLVTRLQHRGIPRALGTGISYIGVVAVLVGVGFLLAPAVTSQWSSLKDDLPQIRDDAVARWNELAEDWPIPTIDEVGEQLGNGGGSLQDQAQVALGIGERVLHALITLILTPIIAFYLLVDLPHLRRVTESLIPDRARPEAMVVGSRLNRAIGGFFHGQLVVALIVGALVSIGLAIIGLPFWLIVGMIAGLFNLIPLIGPYIGAIPGVIVALTTGTLTTAILVVVVMIVAQQIDNHFITPYVMQRAVKVHPVLVMLALLAGGTLFGFFGLLLAVPATAALKILVGHLWRTHVLGEPIEEIVALQAAADARGEGFIADVGGPDAEGVPRHALRHVVRDMERQRADEEASETDAAEDGRSDEQPDEPAVERSSEPAVEHSPEPAVERWAEPAADTPRPVSAPQPSGPPPPAPAAPTGIEGGAPGTRVIRDGR